MAVDLDDVDGITSRKCCPDSRDMSPDLWWKNSRATDAVSVSAVVAVSRSWQVSVQITCILNHTCAWAASGLQYTRYELVVACYVL